MDLVSIVGLVGSILSLVSNIPQLWKVRNINSTNDLHSYSITMHIFSAAVWSAYGFLSKAYILCVESGVVAFIYFLILIAIIRDRCCISKTSDDNTLQKNLTNV
ncbi:MAG: hypothetical protein CMF41_01235 [Legionellales bacterium]|nr:hypothetical protein [Legionellales bacterium]|tara:strand:- start:4687 stop:4998 length:312 start_codon:yes stop_codon:yes gene_type:complete